MSLHLNDFAGQPILTHIYAPTPGYLRKENRFYVFWRGSNWQPTFSTSSDGRKWTEPKTLIQGKGARPYTKIVDDGISSIHFAFTDGHPRKEKKNSLYYLRYKSGHFFKANSSLASTMAALPISPDKADRVYDGGAKGRAWVWDIALDKDRLPVIAFTRLPSETDHRYCYARWDGEQWLDVQVTRAGKWFPQTPDGKREREPHYSGGMALDHANPSILYVSRPMKGEFEIERWQTTDRGGTWRSQAITRQSNVLNVRPVVPRGHTGRTSAVLWMFGSYKHYTKYKTGIKLLTIQN